ncbi:carotenoid biosynthesis protein [Kineococcus rubinsiae]|uniref:carotenoid biosynthesis protein n=1 Tax=Kineococcus rubinsiae TaxID=2609562 RepID=UPI001431CBC5|nr:carotenoid biosynthesis protein [Kineococcus rubinsiae]NIZ92922.1 carotenoid biosynthesis protein [Kineococcus rubinsiae]
MLPDLGRLLTGALTGAAVLSQVAHPLLRGEALRRTTIGSVALFSGASLADAARRGGPGRAALTLGVAGGLGLIAEAVGTRTGRPFGRYRYAGTLGPQVLHVPVVVPLAWTMVAHPAVQLGRRLARHRTGAARDVAVVGAAAWTLASWDLFLDPQMTAAGHWSFSTPHPHLPGLPGIPLSNYAGWVLTAVVICAALHAVVPEDTARRNTDDEDTAAGASQTVPGWLLGWTWLGSTLGNAVFFRRPAVAAWGGLAMGLTAAPYLRSVLADRRPGR